MGYTPYTKLSDLIKSDIAPFMVISLLIILINFKDIYRHKTTSLFEWFILISSVLLYFFVPEGALWNGRVVSFFNLGVIVLFFRLFEHSIEDIFRYEQGELVLKVLSLIILIAYLINFSQKWNIDNYKIFLYPIVFLFFVGAIYFYISTANLFKLAFTASVIFTISFLPYWVSWNFNGYENKDQWTDIEKLYSNLNELPPGRIMWEPNSDLNKYGTPMVLMTIPLYTHHTSMEGLYFDSSITTPFHFIAVSGLAERPSNPVGGLRYINNQFEKGEEYLEELGVDYFISFTDSITNKSLESDKLTLLFSSDPFTVFGIKSNKVELVDQKLVRFEKTTFIERTVSSILRNTEFTNFFDASYINFDNLESQRIIEIGTSGYEQLETSSEEVKITNLKMTSETITFKTNKPNKLHIIKISYFPNWQIQNGSGPYRVSPSFMAVVPFSENVELRFETTRVEKYSFYTSLFSLILFLGLIKKRYANVKNT